MSIYIRQATLSDLNYIQDLSEEVLPNAFHGVLTTEQIDYMLDRLYSQEALSAELNDEQKKIYVASIDGHDVAYACIIKQGPDLFFLPKIYVDNREQSKGIGSALFKHVLNELKKIHPEPLTIEVKVNRHNRARKFYQKLGFNLVREVDTDLQDCYISQEVWSLSAQTNIQLKKET